MSLEDFAEELHSARIARTTVATITSRWPYFSTSDAYAVQTHGIKRRISAGESIVGGKLGFTSQAMQRAMGVSSPNYGWLTDAMLRTHEIRLADLIHPKVEPEIAFTLSADLDDKSATAADVLAATRSVAACLEVVDSRYHGFSFLPNDNIADNSSAGHVVLGEAADSSTADLKLVGVVVSVDDRVVHTAAGAAALGDPAAAVAWMARTVAGSLRPLRAGDIVISGGLTAPVDVSVGQRVCVQIDRVGTCSLEVKE